MDLWQPVRTAASHNELLYTSGSWHLQQIDKYLRDVQLWTIVYEINKKQVDEAGPTVAQIKWFYSRLNPLMPHERPIVLGRLHWSKVFLLCQDKFIRQYVSKSMLGQVIQNGQDELNQLLYNYKRNCTSPGEQTNNQPYLVEMTNRFNLMYNFVPAAFHKRFEKRVGWSLDLLTKRSSVQLILGPTIVQALCSNPQTHVQVVDVYCIGQSLDLSLNSSLDLSFDTRIRLGTTVYPSIELCVAANQLDLLYQIDQRQFYCTPYFYVHQKLQVSKALAAIVQSKPTNGVLHLLDPYDKCQMLDKCYHCKRLYRKRTCRIVAMYGSMCTDCGLFNSFRRFESFVLNQRVDNTLNKPFIALVTGGRIKIGYQLVLQLLRTENTIVITTTRFMYNALSRYQKEPDYAQFKDRLHLFQLDLRDMSRVQSFVQHIQQQFGYLDLFINNAAQTFTYDDEYYNQMYLYETEQQCKLTTNNNTNDKQDQLTSNNSQQQDKLTINNKEPSTNVIHNSNSCVVQSDNKTKDVSIVPFTHGRTCDQFGELITVGGRFWNLEAYQVGVQEIMEINLVNSIVPQYLISALQPMMNQQSNHDRQMNSKYIVLVTCQEGRFSMTKKPTTHFHTNAAKAACNMITRTVADEYRKSGIYINSVDPGFISFALDTNRACPLDCVDAAKRILYPIVLMERMSFGQLQNAHGQLYGRLWKNYATVDW